MWVNTLENNIINLDHVSYVYYDPCDKYIKAKVVGGDVCVLDESEDQDEANKYIAELRKELYLYGFK